VRIVPIIGNEGLRLQTKGPDPADRVLGGGGVDVEHGYLGPRGCQEDRDGMANARRLVPGLAGACHDGHPAGDPIP
jgi:hypothetical protein